MKKQLAKFGEAKMHTITPKNKNKSFSCYQGWFTTMVCDDKFEVLHEGRFDALGQLVDDKIKICRQKGQLHILSEFKEIDIRSLQMLMLIYEGQITYYHTMSLLQLEHFVEYMEQIPREDIPISESKIATIYTQMISKQLNIVSNYIYITARTFLDFQYMLVDMQPLDASFDQSMSESHICYPVCIKQEQGCKIFRGYDGYVVYVRADFSESWLRNFFIRVPYSRYTYQEFNDDEMIVAEEEFLEEVLKRPFLLMHKDTYKKLLYLVKHVEKESRMYYIALGLLRQAHYTLYYSKPVARGFLFSGRPGLGKTYDALKIARDQQCEADVYSVSFGKDTKLYYDGYYGQRSVFLDDLGRYSSEEWNEIVRLINDKVYYPPMAMAEKKGNVAVVASEVYVTTNKFDELMKLPTEIRDSICRRIELIEYHDDRSVTHSLYDMESHKYFPIQHMSRDNLHVYFEEQVKAMRVLPYTDDSSTWLWKGLNVAVHFVKRKYGVNLRPVVDWLSTHKDRVNGVLTLSLTTVVGVGACYIGWKYLKGLNGNFNARKRYKYVKRRIAEHYNVDVSQLRDDMLTDVRSKEEFEKKFFSHKSAPAKRDVLSNLFEITPEECEDVIINTFRAQGSAVTERRKKMRSSKNIKNTNVISDYESPLTGYISKYLNDKGMTLDEYLRVLADNQIAYEKKHQATRDVVASNLRSMLDSANETIKTLKSKNISNIQSMLPVVSTTTAAYDAMRAFVSRWENTSEYDSSIDLRCKVNEFKQRIEGS